MSFLAQLNYGFSISQFLLVLLFRCLFMVELFVFSVMMFPVINIIEKKVLHNTEENLKQGVRSHFTLLYFLLYF